MIVQSMILNLGFLRRDTIQPESKISTSDETAPYSKNVPRILGRSNDRSATAFRKQLVWKLQPLRVVEGRRMQGQASGRCCDTRDDKICMVVRTR